LVEYRNQHGQPVRGIVDRTSAKPGAKAVIIPPAWGRTKETLLPLARMLVETFKAAGEELTVLRFDGTQRRGESYVDPSCRAAGDENLHFTYTQAAEDLKASYRFLKQSPLYAAQEVVLVTFSLAAIEGRRALASGDCDFSGWVAAVGMTDVQSALKAVSGGIDFVVGKESGVEFGIHELGGVRIDIDHAAEDVLAARIATLEEAKWDMAAIGAPVTWLHGRYDGWTNLERVKDLLSGGTSMNRKLIEVPTGHQLRNSREALDVFQLIAHEVSGMLLPKALSARLPDLADLERRSSAERGRIQNSEVNLRRFWHDYLVGRDGSIGMQLLGATSGYATFMAKQISALDLSDGMRVLDLGCGTGEFGSHLRLQASVPSNLALVSADLVPEALRRARERAKCVEKLRFIPCNVDLEIGVPFASRAFDRLICSLVVSYVEDAARLVTEAFRVLRPGGVLVLSSPKRDADLSSLYQETMEDLLPEDLESMAGYDRAVSFEDVQRNYLNEAARLLDFEELGQFRFRDADELEDLVSAAGFVDVETSLSLGSPPQAVVVRAVRGESG
jgi:ubiquinone/menaquinone biosynthesis C-methylase UbiE